MDKHTPPDRPPTVPSSYVPVWCEETELWGWLPSRSRRRPEKHSVPPTPQWRLDELVAEYKVPIPSEFFGREREEARTAGVSLYWSNDGCGKHGFPMLRRSRSGTCVVCDKLRHAEERAKRATVRENKRVSLDEMPRSVELARKYMTKFYWTGEPCQKGHLSERRTISGACIQCECIRKGRKYLPPIPSRRKDNKVKPELAYVPPPMIDDPAPSQISKHADTSHLPSLPDIDSFMAELTGLAPRKPDQET